MKKKLMAFAAALVVIVCAGLSACSGNAEAQKKIDAFVEQMNSDVFKEQAKKTGIYTDSEASIDGDAVVLKFKTIEGLRFEKATDAIMAAQKEGLVKQFRSSIPADPVLRGAFEGMDEKDMVFRLVMEDVNGNTAQIDINPDEVLG